MSLAAPSGRFSGLASGRNGEVSGDCSGAVSIANSGAVGAWTANSSAGAGTPATGAGVTSLLAGDNPTPSRFTGFAVFISDDGCMTSMNWPRRFTAKAGVLVGAGATGALGTITSVLGLGAASAATSGGSGASGSASSVTVFTSGSSNPSLRFLVSTFDIKLFTALSSSSKSISDILRFLL